MMLRNKPQSVNSVNFSLYIFRSEHLLFSSVLTPCASLPHAFRVGHVSLRSAKLLSLRRNHNSIFYSLFRK